MNLSARQLFVIACSAAVILTAFIVIILNLGKNENVMATGTGSAVANGSWNASSSWLFNGVNRVPTCGDTITIASSRIITVSSQENISGCGAPVLIYVYGTLQFTNGNKLELPCGSMVYIMAGGVVKKATAGGGSSTLISMCSQPVWTAGEGPVPGPDSIMVPPPTTLPIKLMYFQAKAEASQVILKWATSSETNNEYFTLERSADGEIYAPVLKKKGAGNSTDILYYQVYDETPLAGHTFYRLKQTDFDGKSTYSHVQSVKYGQRKSKGLVITSTFPNPFTDFFSIAFTSGESTEAMIYILNADGKIMNEENISVKEGANAYEFTEGASLKKGIYYIIIKNGKEKYVHRILKR